MADLSGYRRSHTEAIDASADRLYELVADVANMGRWSPVCTGGEYDADDPTWFTGHNAIGDVTWTTRCQVVAAEPGQEFAFVNHGLDGEHALVRWGFAFEPLADDRTAVTQSWEVLPTYAAGFAAEGPDAGELADRLDFMQGMAETGLPETLAALKQEAEAG